MCKWRVLCTQNFKIKKPLYFFKIINCIVNQTYIFPEKRKTWKAKNQQLLVINQSKFKPFSLNSQRERKSPSLERRLSFDWSKIIFTSCKSEKKKSILCPASHVSISNKKKNPCFLLVEKEK